MGSSSSKNNTTDSPSPPSSPLSSVVVRRSRSTRSKVFQSSCLGSRHSQNEATQASENQTKRNEATGTCLSETKSGGRKAEWYGKVKVKKHNETCVASNVELDDWDESSLADTVARRGGDASSRASSSRSSNLSGRFLPRFSFGPGNMSFRLSRANSLGSARSFFASSQRFAISTDEDELPRSSSSGRFNDRNERPQNCDFFPSCFSNRSPSRCSEDVTSNNLGFTPSTANFSDNFIDEPHPASRRGLSGDRNDTRVECIVNLFSPRNHNCTDGFETRVSDRRSAAREPTERNISISRTLSVGRLRDRVGRRSPFPDVCSFQREMETRHASENSVRQNLGGELSSIASEGNDLILSNTSGLASSGASTSYESQYYAGESPRGRETRYNDLLEHRSSWLDRRRRIRSQVYALQRLGRRFENHSGDERSCVLSGQHRTGHCTCRISTEGANLDSDSNARASISRIVMLAEALFEVLDEIHQQSVVLSSQPSVSSIGSVPAPNEVVESLPVKSYNKFRRSSNDEVAQCYICLVEYEEGDILRTLPCHHEFHRTCVDKWLKEIHSLERLGAEWGGLCCKAPGYAHYVEVISANLTHSKEMFDVAFLDIVSCIMYPIDSVLGRVGTRSNFTCPETFFNTLQYGLSEFPLVCVFGIADASTLGTVVKTWAKINQENDQERNGIENGFIVDVTGIAGCISWCKLGFYEADFGWGNPIWIANPVKFPCGFHLLDSVDGKGIEVWMGLPEEKMKLLEKSEDFLSYVYLSQDV
ncbi:hypothetical protein RND71_016174 [Anisodus tanguticus]|uniref:RING-type domain-containing protein n=1 Tax=Anisodus tanguticus TaxID=243964 RepID=A0AAE1S7N8_9SOLA|nr:hypothetical protein RND71_016174 [Anisodus tanguticus]